MEQNIKQYPFYNNESLLKTRAVVPSPGNNAPSDLQQRVIVRRHVWSIGIIVIGSVNLGCTIITIWIILGSACSQRCAIIGLYCQTKWQYLDCISMFTHKKICIFRLPPVRSPSIPVLGWPLPSRIEVIRQKSNVYHH